MNGLHDGVRRRREKAVDEMRPWYRFGLRAAIALEFGPDAGKQNSGRRSSRANQTTSFFLVSGFVSGAYSAKLFAGTRQRFSGLSQPRQ